MDSNPWVTAVLVGFASAMPFWAMSWLWMEREKAEKEPDEMNSWTMDINEQHALEMERMAAIRKVVGIISSTTSPLGDMLYRYESMLEGAIKEAPFAKGDRVSVVRVPEINEVKNRGWMHCTHFLKEGAKATVHCVQLNGLGWRVGLVFDAESFIDMNGMLHATEPSQRGVFFFSAHDVTKEAT